MSIIIIFWSFSFQPFVRCQLGYVDKCPSPVSNIGEPSSSGTPANAPRSRLSVPGLLSKVLPFTTTRLSEAQQSAGVSVLPVGSQDQHFGAPISLSGQLGYVCVFHDALQANQIKTLFDCG